MGIRNAREVDNFLWGLEQYFGSMGMIENGAKVQSAVLLSHIHCLVVVAKKARGH